MWFLDFIDAVATCHIEGSAPIDIAPSTLSELWSKLVPVTADETTKPLVECLRGRFSGE